MPQETSCLARGNNALCRPQVQGGKMSQGPKPGDCCQEGHVCVQGNCPIHCSKLKYCVEYKCKVEECHSEGLKAGGYCQADYACGEDSCAICRSGSKYCVECKCKETRCDWRTLDLGEHSEKGHACKFVSCTERRNSAIGTKLCEIHKCKHPDCPAVSQVYGD